MRKARLVIGIAFIVVAVGLCVGLAVSSRPHSSNLKLPVDHTLTTPNGSVIDVRIANTDPERELGLSYVPSLPANQGMLFLFGASGYYPFWMKGMRFPLDIIWLQSVPNTSTYKVVSVMQDLAPDTYPSSFSPGQASDTVLEINASKSAGYGIVPGAVLSLNKLTNTN